MKKSQDVYMEPEVYHYNNCTVRVYRPILAEEKRARKMEEIKIIGAWSFNTTRKEQVKSQSTV